MSKVGFIGTGSMGRILIEAFLKSGALEPADIVISNRTKRKAERLAELYPGIRLADTNADLIKDSDICLICVKPLEYGGVLDEIKDVLRDDHLVISITSPVMLRDMEARIPCKIAKIVPSITNAALYGASLCMYGSRLTAEDRKKLFNLFRRISRPIEIKEEHIRVASDLASCGPAFLSFLMQRLAQAATEVAEIPEETAVQLVDEMIYGVGKLLTEGGFTLQSLQNRVAVPGGVTRDGLDILENRIGNVFDELLQMTQQKHIMDRHRIQRMFEEHH